MCWWFWLGQETFESYKAITSNLRLKYIIDNPYRPKKITEAGYCFFSWPDSVVTLAIWLLLAAILMFWVYKRINVAQLYACLALGFAGLGTSLLIGFQCTYPLAIFVWISFVSLGFIVGGMSGWCTVLVSYKLPYLGVPERWVISRTTGLPHRYFPFIFSVIIFVVSWHFSFEVGKFVFAEFLHSKALLYQGFALLVLLAGVLGYACIPVRTKFDGFSFNEEMITYIEPIMKINGPATRKEMLYSMFGLCFIFFIVVATIKKGIDGADFLGMVIICFVCMAFVHAENTKMKDFTKVVFKRKRGLWH